MILSKKDLRDYLKQDAIALKCNRKKRPRFFGDEIWKFQILLRKVEYYTNIFKTKKRHFFKYIWFTFKFHKHSIKYNVSIPINVFGPGLSIAHLGTINVNSKARVGKNCRIHEGVTIGSTNGSDTAPIIGDNVFIGTGAKIIGDLSIANDVAIGANAVVVKSIFEEGVTFGGVPAKKISNNSSHANLAQDLFKNIG